MPCVPSLCRVAPVSANEPGSCRLALISSCHPPFLFLGLPYLLSLVLSHLQLFFIYLTYTGDRLVGLVVKAFATRAEDPEFESAFDGIFFGVESYR